MKIYLKNTLSGEKELFVPASEEKVGIYFCGMTVQDRPHLGHMRAFLVGDVLRRFLLYTGYKVDYIQNFTDIDDKIIQKSHEEGIDWRIIADRYIEEYMKASDSMNLLRATHYPKATRHIQEIIELIESLVAKGVAYQAGNSVYYDVSKFDGYGKLSKKNIEDLIEGHRVEPDPNKKNPLDFALWKGKKEGEPYWHSPWGEGRPGWHIECSAMSSHYLGQPLDIHGGGQDLIFPHHENEIAQSEASLGKPFAKYWLHAGYVQMAGEKMSKSTGLFFAIMDILEHYPANAVRLYLLKTHYRSSIDYDENSLKEALSAWERFEILLSRVPPSPDGKGYEEVAFHLKSFEEAMADDLNTPRALSVAFDLVKETNQFLDSGGSQESIQARADLLRLMLEVLGFDLKGKKGDLGLTEPLLEILTEVRQSLREKKDFQLADAIRERLRALGVILEDKPTGTRWRFTGKI